jgi:hypothetical protein
VLLKSPLLKMTRWKKLWLAEVPRDRCYRREGPPGEKECHLPYLIGKVDRFWKSVPFPVVGVPAFPPSTTGVHNMNNPRRSGQTPEGLEREQPRSALQYLERAEWKKYNDRARGGASGSRITSISSEMLPVASPGGDIYAPHGGYQYQEEMVESYDLRESARELEYYRVSFNLLEDRDGHRRQDVALRQRIVDWKWPWMGP